MISFSARTILSGTCGQGGEGATNCGHLNMGAARGGRRARFFHEGTCFPRLRAAAAHLAHSAAPKRQICAGRREGGEGRVGRHIGHRGGAGADAARRQESRALNRGSFPARHGCDLACCPPAVGRALFRAGETPGELPVLCALLTAAVALPRSFDASMTASATGPYPRSFRRAVLRRRIQLTHSPAFCTLCTSPTSAFGSVPLLAIPDLADGPGNRGGTTAGRPSQRTRVRASPRQGAPFLPLAALIRPSTCLVVPMMPSRRPGANPFCRCAVGSDPPLLHSGRSPPPSLSPKRLRCAAPTRPFTPVTCAAAPLRRFPGSKTV